MGKNKDNFRSKTSSDVGEKEIDGNAPRICLHQLTAARRV